MPLSYFQRYGAKRLLKLADILDTADAEHKARGEPTYSQISIAHECGTPACAIGHWAAHNRRRGWALSHNMLVRNGEWASIAATVNAEFGLREDEGEELFEYKGCGAARTAKQAARYIRRFVARKLKEERVA